MTFLKRIIFLVVAILLSFIFLCSYFYFTDTANGTSWRIKNEKLEANRYTWTSFTWVNDTLSGRYFKRIAMFIPCKIEGVSENLQFQFDLGSDKTIIEKDSWNLISMSNLSVKNQKKRLKNPFLFWNTKEAVENISIKFQSFQASSFKCEIRSLHSHNLNLLNNFNNPLIIGTIGVDMFQNKILIIDYPKERFAILDSLPDTFNSNFVPITFDPYGRVLLPMKIKEKEYKILLDNGSSVFPLLVSENKISEFSKLPNIDSFQINSWGIKHTVKGRRLVDSFSIAGKIYYNVVIYYESQRFIDKTLFDAITGNVLFLDKTLIIDFKGKRFGIIP